MHCYNDYTQNFNSLEEVQKAFNTNNLSKRPTIFKRADNIFHPPKRQYLYNRNTNSSNLQQSSNIHRFMKEDFDIYNNTHIKNERIEKIEYTKRNIFVNLKNTQSLDINKMMKNNTKIKKLTLCLLFHN